MEHQLRRAAPRQVADWFGFYRFDNAKDARWRCCRIIDVSPLGAGLELFETSPGESLEGHITVSLELHGDMRSVVTNDDDNTARVGVVFPVPTDAAKEYIRTLGGTHSRW